MRRPWEWYFLRALAHRTKIPLCGPEGAVQLLAWSPDGKTLALVSKHGPIRLWDAELGKDRLSLEGHNEQLKALAWSPDSRQFASGHDGGMIRICKANTGEEVRSWTNEPASLTSLAWSPDGRWLATVGGGVVRLWESTTGKPLADRPIPGAKVLAFSPDGNHLAVGGEASLALVELDPEQGLGKVSRDIPTLAVQLQRIANFNQQFNPAQLNGLVRPKLGTTVPASVVAICWSPDSHRLAVGCIDGFVAQVLDLRSGELTQTQACARTAVAWNSSGTQLALAYPDFSVRAIDPLTSRETFRLPPEPEFPFRLAWSPDGKKLAVNGSKGSAWIWQVEADHAIRISQHQVASNVPLQLASFPKGRWVVWGSRYDLSVICEGTIKKTPYRLPRQTPLGGSIQEIAWSRDGQRFAVWRYTGNKDLRNPIPDSVTLYEGLRYEELHRLPLQTAKVGAIAWSHDGKRLAVAEREGLVRVWNADLGKELFALGEGQSMWGELAWSADSTRLAAVHEEAKQAKKPPRRIVTVWDIRTGKSLCTFDSGVERLNVSSKLLSWSTNGHSLAVVGLGTITVWDTTVGCIITSFPGSNPTAWSPDRALFATSGRGGETAIYDAASGKLLQTLRRHGGSKVIALCWHPDGRRLATAGYDRTVKVWDIELGHELLTLATHVTRLAWSLDGRQLAGLTADRRLIVWDATMGYRLTPRLN